MDAMVQLAAVAVVVAAALIAFGLARRSKPHGQMEYSYSLEPGEKFRHRWGFTDTRFVFDGPQRVRVTGDRYPLSGTVMPGFVPFAEEVLQVTLRPEDIAPEIAVKKVPPPVDHAAFLAALGRVLKADQVSQDEDERLAHSHGQLSVDEVYRLLYDRPPDRVADVVLYPDAEDQVQRLVALAGAHDVVLVPYGGGTNVSGALALPVEETRMIASVDMARLNRILWVDEQNLQACVQAGIRGMDLERQLLARGYTSGHDPDSVELSTLGGWIATNASGMKRNKYGNIEEIVVEATLVTPSGDVEMLRPTPRNSTGVQPKFLLYGSEGNFGVITRAVLRIHAKPQAQEYGSLVFASFARGVAFLKELRQLQGVVPASIRLVNNFEFRFGQALKPEARGTARLISHLQKFVLLKVYGLKPMEMCACTILMEGTVEEVRYQRRVIFGTGKRYGGISGGASNGKRGYMLTFAIAYIREFFNQFHILGETFETTVPWDRIMPVVEAAHKCLLEQCSAHGVEGRPYLSYRVTQTYQTGVCVYFTMGFNGRNLPNRTAVYHDIEHRIRQTILDHGGSLSHHHGIGKIRTSFLPQIQTPATIAMVRNLKRAVDPANTFAIANNVCGLPDGAAQPQG
jgi:alkyldihydroxyacetonephosphate synthase